MPSAFVVFGYDPARERDLHRLQRAARRDHDAELVLCQAGETAPTTGAVRHRLTMDLWPDPANVDAVTRYAAEAGLDICGVLPLTEGGTPLASLVAHHLDLPGPAALPATVGAVSPAGGPFAGQRTGSSESGAGLAGALGAGGQREYSVDHVAGLTWVTEHEVLPSGHGTVLQQIVPAPLDPAAERRLIHAALSLAHEAGFQGSPFHHRSLAGTRPDELQLHPGSTTWDLAAYAYAPLDPWANWLAWARSGCPARSALIGPRSVAGIRRLRAPRDGTLTAAPTTPLLKGLKAEFGAFVREIRFDKQAGDRVTRQVRTHADWLGYVVCVAPQADRTRRMLASVAARIESGLTIT